MCINLYKDKKVMNDKHVVLNYDKFSFTYKGDKTLYYCTPSYEKGYVLVLWLDRNGIPEGLPEPITLMFNQINSGRIKVIGLHLSK